MSIQIQPGQPIRAVDIKRLFDLYEKMKNVRGGAGIEVRNTPTGIYIALAGGSGGSATASVFPVKVSSDGGSAGAIGSTCSFTYTVTDLNGNDLKDGMSTTATGKPPILARRIPNVTYTVAPDGSYATAFYDETGALRLVDVQETFSSTLDCGNA